MNSKGVFFCVQLLACISLSAQTTAAGTQREIFQKDESVKDNSDKTNLAPQNLQISDDEPHKTLESKHKDKSAYQPDDQRLKPFEPTYVVYNFGVNDDENAYRAHYSFRYDIDDSHSNRFLSAFKEAQVYGSYTGEFDFYWFTRKSSPVVNRINNPAIHLRLMDFDFGLPESFYARYFPLKKNMPWIDFSLEHRSNGQTVDTREPRDQERIEFAYQINDHKFFDTISRNQNFLAAELSYIDDAYESKIFFKAKLYLNQEADITWGKNKNSGYRLSDFDRFRLIYQHDLPYGEWSLEWTLGDSGFKTDSINAQYILSKHHPFFIQFHFGPMYTLANYAESENYFGIGYKFIPDF